MELLNFTNLKLVTKQHLRFLIVLIFLLPLRTQAQVLINEDFSSASGFTPPTGWTNLSLNSTDPWDFSDACGYFNFGFDAGTTNMGGNIAIMNTDCSGIDQVAELTTPTFSASGLTGNIILEFDGSVYNYYAQVCQVDVWNGSAWTNVYSVIGNDDGPYSALHKSINITSAVGGSSAAKVRFHYEGDYEYWWAIDNVKITHLNCTAPAATFAITADCPNNQFSVTANVTSLGSATDLTLSNGTNTYGSLITAPGTYTAGPFTQQSGQVITLIHNQNNICNLASIELNYNCVLPSDYCSDPVALTSSGTCTPYSGNTTSSTASTTGLTNCQYENHGDQWFSFQATHTEHFITLSNIVLTNSSVYDAGYGIAAFSGSCGDYTEIDCSTGEYYNGNASSATIDLTNLTVGETYYINLWKDYTYDDNYNDISTDFSFDLCLTEPLPPPVNDSASGAIAITVGATCSGNTYTNQFATLSPGEPYPSCNTNSEGEHSMWFKFVAPASGSVRITTDNTPQGTLTDSKIGLFSATDSSDYSTFTILACDDDNGTIGSGYNSTIYTTDLVSGQTYYVEVDGYSATNTGTFCLQIEEINPSMLSSSASCASLQSLTANESTYTGWLTFVDDDGKLVANVRNEAGGAGSDYSGSYNIDGNGFGTPRQDPSGNYYLSRNFMISNSSITTPVDVRFYFHPGEIATLAGVTGNATTLSNLNVTKQESNTCNADFAVGNGATSVLTQNANGAVNGVSWIQVTTSSFSNFYLMGGSTPLPVLLQSISAKNNGNSNFVNWSTSVEGSGDYFELERSADGKNFSFLTKMTAKGKPSDYTYEDQLPLNGINYYRLKFVSAQGKINYSKIVDATAKSAQGFDVQAYPNPATQSITVMVYGSQDGVVSLTDISGREVYRTTVAENQLNIDLKKLNSGVYFLRYADLAQYKIIKFSKQ